MDRITKSLLDEFVTQNGLNLLAEDAAFEHFTGFIVTSKHFTETFSSDDIHVGAGGDCGMDSIAIIVNGCLVTDPEEIEDLCETNGYLDVTFVFNQAERSSSFDTKKVGQISFGINDFFATTPSLPQNALLKKKAKIVSEIFNRSSKFKKGNPQCFIYYTTTGKFLSDPSLLARKEFIIKELQSISLFRKVDFEYIDAERIQTLFRETKNAISNTINFPIRTVLPELPKIEQAYLGLLSSTEYLKLIENTNETIITSIFYDNVRHWQEWNAVNKEIKETLENPDVNKYFPLLNNGVTVIAKRIIPTGNKFVIEDYQVVNGCQTSYVLFESKAFLNEDILIPFRLIATQDSEIKNSIIKATNRQTEVTEDQLFALADFPKKLETYFPTFEGSKKLYYERRSRQYNSDEDVEKVRVINMTTLVRAYASFFLDFPHRTTRNYKALLKTMIGDFFQKDHKLEMYYVAAFAHYKLDYLFRSNIIKSNLKPARYHLLYLFKLLSTSKPLPRLNSNDMSKYCEPILQDLWNDEVVKERFVEASAIIYEVAGDNLHSDNIRTEPFTKQVEIAAKEYLLTKAAKD